VSAFIVEKWDAGFTFGEKEKNLGIKGSPTRELIFYMSWFPATG
jgi:alkylation response protein AidB-like acyl-CoA dehydrogenase